jgi:hypothetical protein
VTAASAHFGVKAEPRQGLARHKSIMPGSNNNNSDFEFEIGDRVRLSALGRQRSPKTPDRTGKIVAIFGSTYKVVMEGKVMPVRLHGSYLEKVGN